MMPEKLTELTDKEYAKIVIERFRQANRELTAKRKYHDRMIKECQEVAQGTRTISNVGML
jgi:fructose-1,6-bisphosphatase